MNISARERFDQTYIPVPESGCWLWTGSWGDKGYGSFSYKSKSMGAHRWGWTLYRGEIPAGLFVCHKCDTPACVNPDHLFLGTSNDNAQDMVRKGRHVHGERSKKAKITAEIALAIRDYPASMAITATTFGISFSAVKDIRNRETWTLDISTIEDRHTEKPIHLTRRQIDVLTSLARLNSWATPEAFGAYVASHHVVTAKWLADNGLVDGNGTSYRINNAGLNLVSQLKPTAPVKIRSRSMSCDCCGKSYMVKLSALKRGWGRFCSRQCKSFRQRTILTTTPESNNGR